MKQFWTVYLPREQVRAYADKTEPTKYPEKFAEFVESSALAKANAEVERLKKIESAAWDVVSIHKQMWGDFNGGGSLSVESLKILDEALGKDGGGDDSL